MSDVRSLLRQQRASRRITHPHAQYSELGSLYCVLCSEAIKAESLWNAHLRSSSHRQRLVSGQATIENNETGHINIESDSTLHGHKRRISSGDLNISDGDAQQHYNKRNKHNDIEIEEDPKHESQNGTLSTTDTAHPNSRSIVAQPRRPQQEIMHNCVSAPSSFASASIQSASPVPRRMSSMPAAGVELTIPSRPATPSSTASTPNHSQLPNRNTFLGYSDALATPRPISTIKGAGSALSTATSASPTRLDVGPTSNPSSTPRLGSISAFAPASMPSPKTPDPALSTSGSCKPVYDAVETLHHPISSSYAAAATATATALPEVDPEEWAAFEADIAAITGSSAPTGTEDYQAAVISAPPMTMAEIEAKKEQAAKEKEAVLEPRMTSEAVLRDEKEEAARVREQEINDMQDLEQRVKRLKDKREELRKRRPSLGSSTAPLGISLPTALNNMENSRNSRETQAVVSAPEQPPNDKLASEMEDNDDEDDVEDDLWTGFRSRR